MKFIADFHIHSHYSIATSSQLTPEHLDYWARIKGIRVVGTGDFTHPGWTRELREKLIPAEPGLYQLRPELRLTGDIQVPVTGDNDVRFLLTAEISNIYKKDGKTRKVHNVVFAPDFETAEAIQNILKYHEFNITSDGRPILGLDSRDLLELCLEASGRIFFVPAHIWTPWFSALGSKSGFDSIEQCYGDLSEHIYAVETGLSSDPPMNWLCGFLDKYTLISNSDAHSPEKLGREGNWFDTELSYPAIVDAMKNRDEGRFLGTLEFFPQEGKYHHDGHRKCGIAWEPAETLEHGLKCPVCGKPVTVGVMHRVVELADRKDIAGHEGRPYQSLIPLKEILSEMTGTGPDSKQVIRAYNGLIRKMGSEFDILLSLPLDEIRRQGGDLLAEGIRRMREREVLIQAGYDGEYGVIRVFGEAVKNGFGSQKALFQDLNTPAPVSPKKAPRLAVRPEPASDARDVQPLPAPEKPLTLNPDQEAAVLHHRGPALILAGPGTGKTRVLTHRILHLVRESGIPARNILAVTFTNRAAGEIRDRLERDLSPVELEGLTACTFHALGHGLLKKHADRFNRTSGFGILDEEDRPDVLKTLAGERTVEKQELRVLTALKDPGSPVPCSTETRALFDAYETFLERNNLFDLDDLIAKPVRLLGEHPEPAREIRGRYQWILVDEYQDINELQYRLVRLLVPDPDANLVVIGDPNQAIYGFRGADVRYILRFKKDFPDAALYPLSLSYRCPRPVLKASAGILGSAPAFSLNAISEGIKIRIAANATDKSEAEFTARTIEQMMGGLRFFSMDSDITGGHPETEYSLSDFAVLCRTGRQLPLFEKAFEDHAIPVQSIGPDSILRQRAVRRVLHILKCLENPQNTWLGDRIMKDYQVDETLLSALRREKPVSSRLACIRDNCPEKSLKDMAGFWNQLICLSEPFGDDSAGFINSAALGMPADLYRPALERVSLMTLHASKGLEFPVVFIAGCEDGLLPYHLHETQSDINEERRLLYVGMTRAKSLLILTHAEKRQIMGKTVDQKRSPFLDAIEQEWMEMERIHIKSRAADNKDDQLGLF
ncbi:UvrD-helicase domain-containing protein [bacterium]|nr:UvrD-helicase domain-containing protein [bacterium]